MKRILSALLCAVLLVGIFAGCGSKKDSSKKKKGNGETITIGLCTSALVEDYDNNAYTKWLEEETGYNIEFQFYSSNGNDAKSQIATTMAGGEKLPDIIWGVTLGTDVYTEYGEDGYFIDLKDYFEDKEKSKTFWDRFDLLSKSDQDSYRRQLSNPETGAMYAFPTFQTSELDTMNYTVYINNTWLKKLGLSVPKSKDELYNVLKAFRTKDPNGSGDPNDEIPMIGATSSLCGNVINYFINQYTYYDDSKYFNLKNGKLTTPFTSNEFREGIKYCNKLVKEELLSGMSLTIGSKELKQMICPITDANGKIDPKQQIVGCFVGHLTLEIENDNPAMLDYVPLDYWSNCVIDTNLHGYNTFITEDCENPDAAWDILMAMTSEEGALRMRYGEKGVDWDVADKGTKSYIGRDAEIKLINNVWGSQNSACWCRIASTILINAENEVTQVEGATEWMTYRNKQFGTAHDNFFAAAEKYNPKELCPVLVYTTDEKEKYDMTISNCKSIINTAVKQFTSAQRDPNSDSEWKKYLSDLDAQGLQDWLKVAQTAYDRQKQ